MSATREPKLNARRWIPALDGIRGLAILLVMLFHYGPELDRHSALGLFVGPFCSYGWTGVDLFFVLSGFLITGILVDSRDAGNYFSSFYARRVLRIFPAYYVSLAILLFVLPQVVSTPPQLPPAGYRWMYGLYIQNWVGIFRFPPQMALTPYWSLAVEEQFYLIWPLVIARFAGRKLLRIIAVVCACAIVLRFAAMGAGVSAEAIYANTLTRMDSLLIGAACAVVVRDASLLTAIRRHARWLWIAPIVPFVGVHFTSSSHKTADPIVQGVGFTIIALSYAGVLLSAFLGASPLLNWFLNSAPLRLFGKYSYAAYLWHFGTVGLLAPYLRGRLHLSGGLVAVLMIIATLLIAIASYHVVERWFLLLKHQFEPRAGTATCRASDVDPQSTESEREWAAIHGGGDHRAAKSRWISSGKW